MKPVERPGAPAAPSRVPRWAALAARLAAGLALAAAGFLKAGGAAQEFAVVIEGYRILPDEWVIPLAYLLPPLEIVAGLALACGYMTRASAAAALAMLGGFIFALSSAALRGIQLPNCGCFGPELHLTTGQGLALDSALLACAALAYRRGAATPGLDAWIEAGT